MDRTRRAQTSAKTSFLYIVCITQTSNAAFPCSGQISDAGSSDHKKVDVRCCLLFQRYLFSVLISAFRAGWNFITESTSCFAALTEKSANATTASKKRDHAVAVRAAATPSRTDRVRLMPWSSGDGDDNGHLLSLMLDVTQRVAALQDAVADMRHQNKLNYRQLKRHMLRLSASRQINVAIPPINAKSGPRPVLQSGTTQCSLKV